jgi:molybdopterin-containing oxidoreductase family membrane subunit
LREEVIEGALSPLRRTTWRYYLVLSILALGTAWGVYAYYIQLTSGLVVTGLRDTVFWGLYITNFVFFIGISHAGTLISAILRVANADWRRPITRMAEYITVMAISVGALYPLIDMGRIDRILNVIFYGRIQSPIVWDFISIATYLVGSITYLYLPLIPDLALCRDRLKAGGLRGWLYRALSLNWAWRTGQRERLGRAVKIMAVIIIPVAVSVHTVVSWIFAMTFREGWRSTIFGPYFVVGAILSGIATIILIMAVFRKVYRLERIITLEHFRNLAYLMLATDLFYIYLMLNEYLTTGYLWSVHASELLGSLYWGRFAPYFWVMVLLLVVPAFIVAVPRTRRMGWIVAAAVLINISMWVKRFVIVIPTLTATPLAPVTPVIYIPSLLEVAITLAGFFGFGLMLALFSKLFPLISIWEVTEE